MGPEMEITWIPLKMMTQWRGKYKTAADVRTLSCIVHVHMSVTFKHNTECKSTILLRSPPTKQRVAFRL